MDALAAYMEGASPEAGELIARPIDSAPTAPEADDAADHVARLYRAELAMVRVQIDALREHAGRWLQPHADGAHLAH